MNAQILASKLHRQSLEKGLSFAKVAEQFGIPNIYLLKNGRYAKPHASTLSKLKLALDVVEKIPVKQKSEDISSEVAQCFRLASALRFSMSGLYDLFGIDKACFYKWGCGEQMATKASKDKVMKLLEFLEEIKDTAEKIRGKSIFSQ